MWELCANKAFLSLHFNKQLPPHTHTLLPYEIIVRKVLWVSPGKWISLVLEKLFAFFMFFLTIRQRVLKPAGQLHCCEALVSKMIYGSAVWQWDAIDLWKSPGYCVLFTAERGGGGSGRICLMFNEFSWISRTSVGAWLQLQRILTSSLKTFESSSLWSIPWCLCPPIFLADFMLVMLVHKKKKSKTLPLSSKCRVSPDKPNDRRRRIHWGVEMLVGKRPCTCVRDLFDSGNWKCFKLL